MKDHWNILNLPKQSMTKQIKPSLDDILKHRNPLTRQSVAPVDVLNENAEQLSEPSAEVNRENPSLIEEVTYGITQPTRKAKRFSFEIYIDQIQTIEDIQKLYFQKTGRKLSSSRLLREALDEYAKKAMELLLRK